MKDSKNELKDPILRTPSKCRLKINLMTMIFEFIN